MEWKDTTSYSRSDKERKPTCWQARAGKLKIDVVYNHIYCPDRWCVICAPFFDTKVLNAATENEAKAEALQLVSIEINAALIALYE